MAEGTVDEDGRPRPATWEAARWVVASGDPAYFAAEFLGFQPDEAQAEVLRQAPAYLRIGLNCNRQWGKSTVSAILAVHRAWFEPGSTTLIVAPSWRQSGETLRKVGGFLRQLLASVDPEVVVKGDGLNRYSLQLPTNGSRIVSLPGVEATTRGFSSVSLLILDEASRIADTVYFGFRPMVARSGGTILMVSTPAGRRGFFYREMNGITDTTPVGAVEPWLRYTGPYTDCVSRIPETFLNEERALGEAYFNQEYLCQFTERGRYVLDEKSVRQMLNEELLAYDWI